MMTDTELKIKGYEILSSQLGLVEMEKFISMVQLDKICFDPSLQFIPVILSTKKAKMGNKFRGGGSAYCKN